LHLKIRSQAEIDVFSSYVQKMIAMEWMDLITDSNTLLIIDDAHNIQCEEKKIGKSFRVFRTCVTYPI